MAGGARRATERGTRPPAFVPFTAKLAPPVPSTPLVKRPRLVDDLLAFPGRVVVLSAPAGYGKSILAAQWLAADPRPGAWLSLDASDNDPHVLLTYLALAAGVAEGHGLDTDAGLDEVLDLLRRLLAARTTPGLLVLDDAHLIAGDGPSAAVLTTLANHVPPGSTLAVMTREPPSIPTARGVLHGTARVIDARELAMTPDEAGALLAGSGIAAPDDAAEVLTRVTEGWPAGLYLASLVLRDADDLTAAARSISGRQRRITDFFTEEVLPTIAPDDLAFLLATAVLHQCGAGLCDAVLDRTDSGAVLERLARTNRFVIPLDDTGEWYRYHHLFAEMLLAEARRRDAATVSRVALRAADWWEARLEPDAAVTLALAAPDRERTVDLIDRWGPLLQTDRRRATVERWLSAFSEDEVRATPALAHAAAWGALLAGDIAGVHRYAAALDAAGDDERLPDGTPARAAADLMTALTTAAGLTAMADAATAARATFRVGSVHRSISALLEANARSLLGDFEGSADAADETIAVGRTQVVSSLAQGLAARARLDALRGAWDAAEVVIEEGIAVAEDHWFDERPAFGLAYATASLVSAHLGRVQRARDRRAVARPLVRRLDDVMPFLGALALIEMAESAVLTDDVDEATLLLSEAERRLRRLRDTGLLPFALERVGARISVMSVRSTASLVEPISPAEMRVLAYLPTHLSFGEIGEELFLSRNTVKSHAMAIYRKLGVTSRSAAVKEAGELGILR